MLLKQKVVAPWLTGESRVWRGTWALPVGGCWKHRAPLSLGSRAGEKPL